MKTPDPKVLFSELVRRGFLKPLTPEAQKQALGIKMQAPEQSVHAQIAEELIAIQQRNSKGFRVIDFSPFNFPRDDFYPQMTQGDLVELFGPEAASLGGGYYEDSNVSANSILPYWRTVEIPISGNFLKIEFLPVRLNEAFSVYDPSVVYPIADNTKLLDNSDQYQYFSPKHSAQKNIIVHFQDTQTNPILAKHGDTFETEFTSFFVTFKAGIPRFRVTIGYNSKMTGQDDRLLNTKLAYGPGHGMFNNPTIHATPFCVTQRDLNAFQNTSAEYPSALAVGAGTEFNADLFTNVPNILNRCYSSIFPSTDFQLAQYTSSGNSKYNADNTSAACAISGGIFVANNFQVNGMTVGWITAMSLSALYFAAGAGNLMLEMILETFRYTSTGGAGGVIRRIGSVQVSVGSTIKNGQITKTFKEPMRFCLEPRDSLRILIRNATGTNYGGQAAIVQFGVEGYTWGPTSGLGVNAGFPAAPFQNDFKMTENPYPIDQSYLGTLPSY